MVGSHLIKTWSKTQATIAKSSAESELYGIVRATCETLGLITLMEDLGGTASARLHMDATAASGIVDREGVSKVRHLDVNILWLQEQLAGDKVPLLKVLGTENSADLATKHLSQDMIHKHTERMNLGFREGGAEVGADDGTAVAWVFFLIVLLCLRADLASIVVLGGEAAPRIAELGEADAPQTI